MLNILQKIRGWQIVLAGILSTLLLEWEIVAATPREGCWLVCIPNYILISFIIGIFFLIFLPLLFICFRRTERLGGLISIAYGSVGLLHTWLTFDVLSCFFNFARCERFLGINSYSAGAGQLTQVFPRTLLALFLILAGIKAVIDSRRKRFLESSVIKSPARMDY